VQGELQRRDHGAGAFSFRGGEGGAELGHRFTWGGGLTPSEEKWLATAQHVPEGGGIGELVVERFFK
jgi:hypothetical protein